MGKAQDNSAATHRSADALRHAGRAGSAVPQMAKSKARREAGATAILLIW